MDWFAGTSCFNHQCMISTSNARKITEKMKYLCYFQMYCVTNVLSINKVWESAKRDNDIIYLLQIQNDIKLEHLQV